MSHLLVERREDGIAVVTLDRPKANAIDAATSVQLGEAFLEFEHDAEVRVVIVTGGARGIGREHCLEFARQGARIVVNDLGSERTGEGRSSEPAAGE